jgi:signal transduction histidine kinase
MPPVRHAWRGLVHTLIGPDQVARWRQRSPAWRRTGYAALAVTTVALAVFSLVWLADQPAPMVNFLRRGTIWRAQVVTDVGELVMRMRALAFLPGGPMTLMVLVALAVLTPLPMAARYPLLGWRIAWLGLWLVPLLGVGWWYDWPWDAIQLPVLVVVFVVAGLRHERWVLGWMWALSLVPWWFWAVRGSPGPLGGVVGTVALTVAAVAVDGMRSRQSLADQAELTELERARRAVLEERTRIARELHDVVAHHMSLIAVRAETAPYRLSGLPDATRAEFGALSGAAREALNEMRRLLGVLRQEEAAARSPQPGLSDLPGLVDAARRAGLAVELSAPARLDEVPFGVGECVYRIVQESLSNASRHAPGAPVTVSVDHDPSGMLLRVANGPAVSPSNGHGPGHGLTGMRERVTLLGGSLVAAPSSNGGFVVSAVLPWDQPS